MYNMLIGSKLGEIGGEFLGKKYGGTAGGQAGKLIGGLAGSFLPFARGGRVVKKTQKALLHKGEIVVPAKYAKDVSKTLKNKIKKNGGRNM